MGRKGQQRNKNQSQEVDSEKNVEVEVEPAATAATAAAATTTTEKKEENLIEETEPAAIRALSKAPKVPLPKLDILLTVRQSRLGNGLRADQYDQYRQYCSRRVHRLRKSLKVTMSSKGTKFHKPDLPRSEQVTAHPEHLLIFLMCAERAWAFSMHMRQFAVDGSDERTRAFYTVRKKLRSAVKHANILEKLALRDCEARTALEASLYALWTRGNNEMENGEWEQARADFVCSSAICQLLLRLESGNAESGERQSMLQERIDEMSAKLRLCLLSLKRMGVATDNLESLSEKEIIQKIRPDLAPLLEVAVNRRELVAEGLARGSKEAAAAAAAAGVMWKGEEVPVRNLHAREAFVALRQAILGVAVDDDAMKDEEVAKDAEGGGEFEAIIKALSNATQALKTEERSLQKKAARNAHGSKAEHLRDNALLLEYTAWMRNTQAVKRYLAQIVIAEKSMKEFSLSGMPTADAASVKKPAKAEDIVRMYDNAMQALNEAKALGSPNAPADHPLEQESKEYIARSISLRAERMYYVALGNMRRGRWSEAEALAKEVGNVCSDAVAHQRDCATPDKNALERLEVLKQKLRLLHCVIRARAAAGVEAEDEASADDSMKAVFDAPDTFSINPHRAFVTLPPTVQPMPMRPFLLDVAGTRVEYPDLTNRKKKKGFFSSFFG